MVSCGTRKKVLESGRMTFDVIRIDPDLLRQGADHTEQFFGESNDVSSVMRHAASYIEMLERTIFMIGSR